MELHRSPRCEQPDQAWSGPTRVFFTTRTPRCRSLSAPLMAFVDQHKAKSALHVLTGIYVPNSYARNVEKKIETNDLGASSATFSEKNFFYEFMPRKQLIRWQGIILFFCAKGASKRSELLLAQCTWLIKSTSLDYRHKRRADSEFVHRISSSSSFRPACDPVRNWLSAQFPDVFDFSEKQTVPQQTFLRSGKSFELLSSDDKSCSLLSGRSSDTPLLKHGFSPHDGSYHLGPKDKRRSDICKVSIQHHKVS